LEAIMKKKSASRQLNQRAGSRKRQPEVPVQLRALAALLHVTDGNLGAALVAAKRAAESPEDYPDVIHAYIRRWAETGPHKDDVARAVAVDPGNIDGGLHNAYATPALLAGVAFACVIFGGVR
jgi:hypothetical protein